MHALSIYTFRTGQLIGTWCMRMEGKNSYFKHAAQSSNFKNVSYTVAKKHQQLLCAYLQSDNFFFRSLERGPGTFLTISSTSVCFIYTLTFACILVQIGNEPKPLLAEDSVIIAKVSESASEPMCSSTTTNLVHRYQFTSSHTHTLIVHAFVLPPPPIHSSSSFSPHPVHTCTHTHTHSHRPKWVVHMGIKYLQSDYVPLGWQEDDLPIIGRIQYITVFNNNPIGCGSQVLCVGY